jgi:hypothetical protein
MTYEEALPILRLLADGIDPVNGGKFPASSSYQHVTVVRALQVAIEAVEIERKKSAMAANAGKAWSDREDEQLQQEFHAAVDFREIAEIHGRSRGAILSRLERLGEISPLTKRHRPAA